MKPLRMAATLAALLTALAFTPVAQAQTKMLPGLWEHSFNVQDSGGQMGAAMQAMQAELAKMSPAQRQQMEQMMNSKGMSLGGTGGAGGATVKMCMTQAQVDLSEVPQGDKNCTQQAVQRSGNTMKVKFSCAGTPPTSGEGEVTILSPTAYTGKSVINTTVAGKSERTSIDQKGKWLSADCGNIKPVAAAKR